MIETNEKVVLANEESVAYLTPLETEPQIEAMVNIDAATDYFRKIGRYPLLNAGQEVALAKATEAGQFASERLSLYENTLSATEQTELVELMEQGARAKEQMITANLRYVVNIAKPYVGRGLPFLDIIQEGNIGLARAVEMFDYTKGFKFSVYSRPWIKKFISLSLANQARMIRIPVSVSETMSQIRSAEYASRRRTGHEPTLDELSAEFNLPPERIAELKHYERVPVSLDLPLSEDGDVLLGDMIADSDSVAVETSVEYDAVIADLDRTLGVLDDDEAETLRLYFGLNNQAKLTITEIATHFGVKEYTARITMYRAMSKMRHPAMAAHQLDDEAEWRRDALCPQVGVEGFFSRQTGSAEDIKQICDTCDVAVQCLAYAIKRGERFGIWGAKSVDERRELAKS